MRISLTKLRMTAAMVMEVTSLWDCIETSEQLQVGAALHRAYPKYRTPIWLGYQLV